MGKAGEIYLSSTLQCWPWYYNLQLLPCHWTFSLVNVRWNEGREEGEMRIVLEIVYHFYSSWESCYRPWFVVLFLSWKDLSILLQFPQSLVNLVGALYNYWEILTFLCWSFYFLVKLCKTCFFLCTAFSENIIFFIHAHIFFSWAHCFE